MTGAERARRAQRRQDLLLASQLMRLQAGAALGQLAERADAGQRLAGRARALLAGPLGWAGAGLLVALGVRRLLRRPAAPALAPRRRPWLRWALLAWRIWRGLPPAWRAQLLGR